MRSKGKPSYNELEERINAQKKHIAELEQDIAAIRYLASAVQNSKDAITVQDLDGNITFWNKAAQRVYGWPKSQALKMNISEIIPPEKKEEGLEFIKDLVQGKDGISFETKRITADGRILDIWLTATILLNEEELPVAVATCERNITDHIQSEKEKNELIKELQKTNGQLQQALAETKTLRGIIPICMVCKQIRNDKGFWEQVEVYVHNHTGADFSHGICPNCLQEKFPKVYKKMLLSAPPPRKMLET